MLAVVEILFPPAPASQPGEPARTECELTLAGLVQGCPGKPKLLAAQKLHWLMLLQRSHTLGKCCLLQRLGLLVLQGPRAV